MVIVILALVAASCDWPQDLGGPAHSGFTPDTSISLAAIQSGTITPIWRSDVSDSHRAVPTSVVGGIAYSPGFDRGIAAYGATGCAGAPDTCTPLWDAAIPSGSLGRTAVSGGVMAAVSVGTPGGVAAFDATGVAGCSGVPKICNPLWTSAGEAATQDPLTVANGMIYHAYFHPTALSNAGIVAYDLTGTENCSGTPKICTPIWRGLAEGETWGAPSVDGGVAYLAAGTRLWAFDAAGATGCSGTPKVCVPLWSADIPSTPIVRAAPIIHNNKVFVTNRLGTTYGFDTAGAQNCTGVPKVCTPVWQAVTGFSPATAAYGRLYARFGGVVQVFDTGGSNRCTGTTLRTCKAIWSYDAHSYECSTEFGCDGFGPFVIANGVLYAGWNPAASGLGEITAYDANGVVGCRNEPKRCGPLRSFPTANGTAPVTLANGFLYVQAQVGNGVLGIEGLRVKTS